MAGRRSVEGSTEQAHKTSVVDDLNGVRKPVTRLHPRQHKRHDLVRLSCRNIRGEECGYHVCDEKESPKPMRVGRQVAFWKPKVEHCTAARK